MYEFQLAASDRSSMPPLCEICMEMISTVYLFARPGLLESKSEEYDRANRTPKKTGKAKIPWRLRIAVYERDRYRCAECDSHTSLSLDHIIPESSGGPTTEGNLRTLCRSCNSKKGTKMQKSK